MKTHIEFSSYFCSSLINGYEYSLYTFEPVYFAQIYGKGLGLAFDYYYDPAEFDNSNYKLFYFKKNNLECGIPDTTVGIRINAEQIKAFEIFPNPATSAVFIRNLENEKPFELFLYDGIGRQIFTSSFSGKVNELDIRDFKSGMYLLILKTERKTQTFNLIKE